VLRIFHREEILCSVAMLTLAFPGCAVRRPLQSFQPAVAVEDHFLRGDLEGRNLAFGSTNWWRSFNNPTLDELISVAFTGNLELRQFVERIEQADARLRQAGGRLLPQLDADGGLSSRWSDGSGIDFHSREDASSLGIFFGWEIDFWGRLRFAKGARAQETEAALYDWLGARLMLSASIAETYFGILEQHQQLNLLHKQIEISSTLLDLTRFRFGQGLSSIVDVLQQQEQLASTRSRIPQIEGRLEQLELALDVLLGTSPGTREKTFPRGLDDPPERFTAGVPSDLLDNRPDLLASRHQVSTFDYRVGEAIAERLPRFTIGGSLSAAGDSGLGVLVANAIASVAGPVFDAGIRRAEVDLRRSQLKEAVAEYSSRYLTAVREVETSLLLERKQADSLALLENQLSIAERLLQETRNRYIQGLTEYLPVLAAVGTVQDLQRNVLTSRRELLSIRVTLHRSLGGPMNRPDVSVESSTRRRTGSGGVSLLNRPYSNSSLAGKGRRHRLTWNGI